MTLNDYNLATATLIEQYKSQGYSDYLTALKIALDEIELRIIQTKGIWTKNKRREIKKLIEDEITKAYGGLFASIQDESKNIATITYTGAMGVLGLESKIPTNVVKDLIDNNREIQASYNIKKDLVKTYTFKDLFNVEDNQVKQLKIALAGAVAQNKSPMEISRTLRNASRLTASQLNSSVFTVIQDSRSQSIYESYKQIEKAGLDVYYEHNSTLDGNTSDTCISLDGRKYYMAFEEIPSYLRPPIHLNCRSALIQKVKGEDYKGLRSSAFGEVDSDIKYPQWLANQTPKAQKIILGANRYKLYKEGKYKVNSLPDVIGGKYGIDTFESKVKQLAG